MRDRITLVTADTDGRDALVAYLDADHSEIGWQHRAACVNADPELFFPERGEDLSEVRAICRGCEVRLECLEYALGLSDHAAQGVWGGTSERQRRGARRRGLGAAELLAEIDQPRRVVRSTIGNRAIPAESRPPAPERPPCVGCGGRLARRDPGPYCWACADAA